MERDKINRKHAQECGRQAGKAFGFRECLRRMLMAHGIDSADIETMLALARDRKVGEFHDKLQRTGMRPFVYAAIRDGGIVCADKDDEMIFYWRAGGGQCDEVVALYRGPSGEHVAAQSAGDR